MRTLSVYLIGALFIVAGVLHFVRPETYVAIMPPFLPWPRALVYASGVAEVVGGVGVLVPALRPWAGAWLIAVLLAVFPANVYMALAPEAAGFGIDPLWLWLRLPMQAVFIAWVWWATILSSDM